MSLADELLDRIADPAITRDERARLRVLLSKALEEAGDYEGARAAMGELWSRVGERPVLDGLDRETAAEVLMQAGVLTSCIGSAGQIEGAQEVAKDLIGEAARIFEDCGRAERVAEAQAHLAYCYWRQGAYDEARVTLREALSRLTEKDDKVKALVLLRSAIIERVALRLNDALRILMEAAPLFERSDDDALKGKFHNQFGTVLKNLGAAERRPDYLDRTLVEYAAASYHFERAGHERFRARVENNLGMLFSTLGRFSEAHEHVGRAREIFTRLRDSGSAAQVDDTRARMLLAEGRGAEAEKVARSAVRTLERGDEKTLLAEALTTLGVALARTGRYARARSTLRRAVTVAEQAGDREGAGQAALAVLEELNGLIPAGELRATCERAAELLADSQHPALKDRLLSCAIRLLSAAGAGDVAQDEEFKAPRTWKDFSFREAIRRYERFLIELALKDAGGVVSRAAQLLGYKYHQSLISLINHRHPELLRSRSPVWPRRRSIVIPEDEGEGVRGGAEKKAAGTVAILLVEDDEVVAGTVREMLEYQGWKVVVCADGRDALRRISGGARYDLLLLDNELPGVKGVELVRRARKLPHRRRTPIIMLSASDVETEAWRAGVNAFLQKPDRVRELVSVVRRLLNPDVR
jgi:CheY-like chemotaxis protein